MYEREKELFVFFIALLLSLSFFLFAVFASSSLDGRLKVWDFATTSLVKEIEAGPGTTMQSSVSHFIDPFFASQLDAVESWAVSFSPDSKYVASTGQSGNITIWDLATSSKVMSLQTNSKFTMPVVFVSLHIVPKGEGEKISSFFFIAPFNRRRHNHTEHQWFISCMWKFGWRCECFQCRRW
jgi:WD40 repeat protein